MFNIFKSLNKDGYTVNESSLYDEHGFYSAFSKDIKSASHRVIIESPYITTRRAKEFADLLSRLNKRLKVTIYTRNPYHHDGVLIHESLEGIALLKEAGIYVKTCDDFRHRKVAIIDNTILWEGSLNMLSQNGSREMMRRFKSSELVSEMEKFLGIKWYSRS